MRARVVFQGSQPPVISQMSWEGLEFFPDPEACTITPGELDDEIGVGYAEIRCEGLADIRGGGTVDMAGTLGLALTTVGESDLPPMGGSVAVGDESWEFTEAFLFGFPVNLGPGTEDFNMVLTDEGSGSLRFRYDVQTHRLTLVNVERGGEASDLDAGGVRPPDRRARPAVSRGPPSSSWRSTVRRRACPASARSRSPGR